MYVVQTLGNYMHAIRRRFQSSNVRWFKITNTTKQLVYQTALILCSDLVITLYYIIPDQAPMHNICVLPSFFLLFIQIRVQLFY